MKVAVIGAESTGKSTLCEQLAHRFKTSFTIEFAREYLTALQRDYTEDDLLIMAKGQIHLENVTLKMANRFLFCDTDIMNIRVWSEVKFGKCSSELLSLAAKQEYDIYFLLLPERPWEEDPLRENPDTETRLQLTKHYQEYALGFNKPLHILGGNEPLPDAIRILHKY